MQGGVVAGRHGVAIDDDADRAVERARGPVPHPAELAPLAADREWETVLATVADVVQARLGRQKYPDLLNVGQRDRWPALLPRDGGLPLTTVAGVALGEPLRVRLRHVPETHPLGPGDLRHGLVQRGSVDPPEVQPDDPADRPWRPRHDRGNRHLTILVLVR